MMTPLAILVTGEQKCHKPRPHSPAARSGLSHAPPTPMQAGRNVSKKNVLILNNRDPRRGPGDKPRAFIKLSYQELQSILF